MSVKSCISNIRRKNCTLTSDDDKECNDDGGRATTILPPPLLEASNSAFVPILTQE